MKPEEKARQNIDQLLTAAGWTIQNRENMDLSGSQGIAVSEFPMTYGTPDYLLFVDKKAVGVIEAKPEGTTLSGVSEQTEKYLTGVPALLPVYRKPLPFGYETTGIETSSEIYAIQTPAPAPFSLFINQKSCYSGSGSSKHCDTIFRHSLYWKGRGYETVRSKRLPIWRSHLLLIALAR